MSYKGSRAFRIARALQLKGGVEGLTLAGNLTLTTKSAQFLNIDPTANRTVTLPAEEGNEGHFFFIRNSATADSGEAITVKNDGGSTVVTLQEGEWGLVAVDGWETADTPAWQLVAGSGQGSMSLLDNVSITWGTGGDLKILHDATDSIITSTTGNLLIDSQDATGAVQVQLGTDDGNTKFQVLNDSGATKLQVDAAGAVSLTGTFSRVGSITISDPGDTGAIAVTASGVCAITTAGAETRTLAIPTAIGQVITLCLDTDGGDAVVTVAAAVNQTGNNTLTFADAGDEITLRAITKGGALVWRVVSNDGVALSTV